MTIHLTPTITAILATHHPLLMVSFSGGKDSIVTLHAIHQAYSATHQIEVVYADTGWEYENDDQARWENTTAWCQQAIAPYGYQLHIVKHPTKTLPFRIEERGKFPSPGQRFCTSDFKTGPLNKWLRHQHNPHIICIDGRRAAESAERARLEPWSLDDELTVDRSPLTKTPRTVYRWLPIFDWTTPAVFAYCTDHGLALPYQYNFLSRYSCRICIYNTAQEIAAIRQHDPKSFHIMRQLEQRIDFTMKSGKNLDEVANAWEQRQETLANTPQQACLF